VTSPTGECAVRYGAVTAKMTVPKGASRLFPEAVE
jgi:hypothetical protein